MIKAIFPLSMGLLVLLVLSFGILFTGNSLASGYGNTGPKYECMACHQDSNSSKKEVISKSGVLPKVKIIYFIGKSFKFNKQTKEINKGRLLHTSNTFKVPWKTKQSV